MGVLVSDFSKRIYGNWISSNLVGRFRIGRYHRNIRPSNSLNTLTLAAIKVEACCSESSESFEKPKNLQTGLGSARISFLAKSLGCHFFKIGQESVGRQCERTKRVWCDLRLNQVALVM
jgi:hypothetical protein